MNPSGDEGNEGGHAPTDTDTRLRYSGRLVPVTRGAVHDSQADHGT
jgi:hypothetical protein